MGKPPSTPLGRAAVGLPRYYMDVGWYRHPSFAGLGLDALGLFEAVIGYSHEHATDGRCPANHEDLAAALGLRASEVRKALKALVDRGRLVPAGTGLLRVAGFEDHNPTAAEIEEATSKRSAAGSYGNHKRWHLDRGVKDPECSHCDRMSESPPDRKCDPDSDPGPDGDSDPPSDPNPIALGSHGMGWDGITTSSSSTVSRTGVHPSPDDDDRPGSRTERVDRAIDLLAKRDLERRQAATHLKPVEVPSKFLDKCRTARRADHAADLHAAAHKHPDWTPEQLADLLDPPPPPPPVIARPVEYNPDPEGTLPPPDPTANAAGARAVRDLLRNRRLPSDLDLGGDAA